MILDLARALCLLLHILGFTAWFACLLWRLIVAGHARERQQSDASPNIMQHAGRLFLALEDIGTALILPSGAALLAFTYTDFSPNIVLAIVFVSICWLVFRRSFWGPPRSASPSRDFDRALTWLIGVALIMAGLANLGNLWAALPPYLGLKITLLGAALCLREPGDVQIYSAAPSPPAPWRPLTSLVLLGFASLLGAWQPLFLISL